MDAKQNAEQICMLERVVEANRRAWDDWPDPIDLSNVEKVRRHAAIEVLKAMREPDEEAKAEVRRLGGPQALAFWLAGHNTMIDVALKEPENG